MKIYRAILHLNVLKNTGTDNLIIGESKVSTGYAPGPFSFNTMQISGQMAKIRG